MFRLLALLLFSFAAAGAQARPAPFTSDRISVEVHGAGRDVVLIPGLSSSPRVWDDTIAAIPGYRYHVVHVSGFDGRPAGANATGPLLVPVAEEIARYIGAARLRRPAIIGHSMGGSWALLVAGRHPQLAGKVMVVDMLPFLGAMFGGAGATPDTIRPIAEQIRQGIATSGGDARRRQVEQTIASMVRTEGLRPAVVAQSLASDPVVSGQGQWTSPAAGPGCTSEWPSCRRASRRKSSAAYSSVSCTAFASSSSGAVTGRHSMCFERRSSPHCCSIASIAKLRSAT